MNDEKNKKRPMAPAGFNTYRKTDVLTASQETILLMLYAGAIRFLKSAIAAAEKNDLAEKAKYVTKTQEIISELRSTLNFEVGGEIALNLERLYGFIVQKLIQSTVEKRVEPLQEALKILETLHEAWEQAIATFRKEKAEASDKNAK